jgi:hypothetical protein
VAGSAFGSFSSWTLGRWDNHLSYDMYLFRDTCNIEVYPGFDPASPSVCVADSRVMIIYFRIESPIPAFRL